MNRHESCPPWISAAAHFIFGYRKPLLGLFVALTVLLGFSASQLQVSAGFTKMLPLKHEYMQTFLEYQSDFGGANKVLVVLKNTQGDIYSKEFMDALQEATEDVFYLEGVERSTVTSLFTPNVRYTEVVEDGFRGGNIVSADFEGRPEQLEQVRANVLKSDWVGRIVANDMSAAMIVATLQERDVNTGQRLDLRDIGRKFEAIRDKHENEAVTVHVIGFAKSIGDIVEGASRVLVFFSIAFLITAVLLYWYSGSVMLSGYALVCAVVPVVWLLGLLPVFGLTLDPMSILVPFLIFSIAISHAVQMTNAWKLETLSGKDGVTAARLSFEKLFVPGAMALFANALGFAVIAFVEIEMVQELTITATLGVTVMIVTNKMLLPILLSYRQFSSAAAAKLHGRETLGWGLWERMGILTEKGPAAAVIVIAVLTLGVGFWVAQDLKVGNLGKGVPELWPSSRYNQDVETITTDFSLGVDVLQVIAEAKGRESPCVDRAVLDKIEEFEFQMNQVDGVAAVSGLAGFVKRVTQSYGETFIKWRAIPDEQAQIAQGVGFATRFGNEFMNSACNAMPIYLFTKDHQAETISTIIDRVKEFKEANDSSELTFRLASGNVGVMAATNEVVQSADRWVNAALFASVALLCLTMFRSMRITLCIVIPLAIVTVLCHAVMASLEIGQKVNTLPVVALGVGVGVDYGIYLFESIVRSRHINPLMSLRSAYVEALKQRGTATVFTAVTMTISLVTWAFSDLKFQADVGLLLAFMFLVNMLGAILLLPALAAYLVGNQRRA